jgi:hypothetical protein
MVSIRAWLAKLTPRSKTILGVAIIAIIVAGVVATAQHNGGSRGAANLPWKSYQMRMVKDPPLTAYYVLTPQSWTWEALLVQGSTGVVHGLAFDTTDNGGKTRVFGYLPVNPIYIERGLGCDNLPDGSFCDLSQGVPFFKGSGYTKYQLVTANQYIQSPLLKVLQNGNFLPAGVTDWSIVQTKERHDLANVFGFLWVTSDGFSGADAIISYKLNGEAYKLGVEVAVSRTGNSFTIPGLVDYSFWTAVVAGVSAPEADFDTAARTFSYVVIPSIKVDKQWALAEVAAAAQRGQMATAFDQRMKAMDLAAFTDSMNSQAAVGRAWGDALGGVQAYVDKTDNTKYTLPYDLGNYYYRSGDNFYPTDTESAPPDCRSSGNCNELFKPSG